MGFYSSPLSCDEHIQAEQPIGSLHQVQHYHLDEVLSGSSTPRPSDSVDIALPTPICRQTRTQTTSSSQLEPNSESESKFPHPPPYVVSPGEPYRPLVLGWPMESEEYVDWVLTNFPEARQRHDPANDEDRFHLDGVGRREVNLGIMKEKAGFKKQGYPLGWKSRKEFGGCRTFICAVSTNKQVDIARGRHSEERVRKLAEFLGKREPPQWLET